MYIQPQSEHQPCGICPPRDYSGNAFPMQEAPPQVAENETPPASEAAAQSQAQQDSAPQAQQDSPPQAPFAEVAEQDLPADAVEAGLFSRKEHERGGERRTQGAGGGFWGKLPFLSSLLPPPRHCKEGDAQGILQGGGRDLLLIGVLAYLLFFDQSEDSILPLLLLLLLWE